MPIFSQSSLRQTLGKGLSSNINKSLQTATGAKDTSTARGQLMKSLAGKSDRQRETVYRSFGIGQSARKQIEGVIDRGEKTYTKNEMVKIRRGEEAKKKINIFLLKRSENQGGFGYQTSSGSFAGGSVETRSCVGALAKSKEERSSALGFGVKKISGLALDSASKSSGGVTVNGGKKDKKANGESDSPKIPSNLSFGGGM